MHATTNSCKNEQGVVVRVLPIPSIVPPKIPSVKFELIWNKKKMDEVRTAFVSFLTSIGNHKKSFWFVILDECIPDKASKATTEAVKPLLTMSLRSVTNLKPKRYFSLLESLGLVKTKGQRVQVQGDGWKQLLGDVGGEATKSFLKGVGKRWVVRIGDKDLGGYDSVREQIYVSACRLGTLKVAQSRGSYVVRFKTLELR